MMRGRVEEREEEEKMMKNGMVLRERDGEMERGGVERGKFRERVFTCKRFLLCEKKLFAPTLKIHSLTKPQTPNFWEGKIVQSTFY